jgi:hypothetical protein
LRSPPRSAGRACVPPGTIPAALPAALVLAIVGAATKVGTGLDGGSSCRHRPSRPRPGGGSAHRARRVLDRDRRDRRGGRRRTRPRAARGVLRPAARGVRPARRSLPWLADRVSPSKVELDAARGRTIPDVLGPDLDIVFVGIKPGLWSGAVGHHFARPGNRFWKWEMSGDGRPTTAPRS